MYNKKTCASCTHDEYTCTIFRKLKNNDKSNYIDNKFININNFYCNKWDKRETKYGFSDFDKSVTFDKKGHKKYRYICSVCKKELKNNDDIFIHRKCDYNTIMCSIHFKMDVK